MVLSLPHFLKKDQIGESLKLWKHALQTLWLLVPKDHIIIKSSRLNEKPIKHSRKCNIFFVLINIILRTRYLYIVTLKFTTEGNGYLLQYCCLGNTMDRGTRQATPTPWGRKRVRQDLVSKQQPPPPLTCLIANIDSISLCAYVTNVHGRDHWKWHVFEKSREVSKTKQWIPVSACGSVESARHVWEPVLSSVWEALSLCAVLSCSVMSDSLWPHGLLCPWRFSRQQYWSGLPCSPPRDLPNPGIKPRSPALQVDSLPAESPRKPMNTGVGRWSLLQGIFLTQESNGGLLHCRRILYQLSYQGSPFPCVKHSKTQIGSATCPAVSFFHAFSKCTRNSLGPQPITVLLNDWVFTYIPR